MATFVTPAPLNPALDHHHAAEEGPRGRDDPEEADSLLDHRRFVDEDADRGRGERDDEPRRREQ